MQSRKLVSILLFAFAFTACGKNSSDVINQDKTYSVNAAILSTPKAFNPHNWETSDENIIPSYTGMGFYQVGLNAKGDGYEIYNEMALSAPVDSHLKVTNEDKKRYGYSGQVSEGYVYDIDLNPNAKFEDGSLIKANDYLKSMELLLSPKMVNFRADSFYSSNVVLANAEAYFKQGKTTIEPLYTYLKDSSDGKPTDKNVYTDGQLFINLGRATTYSKAIFSTATSNSSLYTCLTSRPRDASADVELAAKRIVDAVQYYIFNYIDRSDNPSLWENVINPSDINEDSKLDFDISIYNFSSERVLVRKSLDVSCNYEDSSTYEVYSLNALKNDLSTFARYYNTNPVMDSDAYKLLLFANKLNVETCSFSDVGIKAIDDYTLRFFFSQKISSFDLQFALTSNFLVKTDLYESLMQKNPGSDMYTTKYGTEGSENYMSYGPYKLETFQKDKAITFTRNENWYGYSDSRYDGFYKCDKITIYIVKNHQTIRQMFLKGQLDSIELANSDSSDLGTSSRVKYIPESYTQKISFNSDRDKLKARQDQTSDKNDNKTLLSNLDFRTALSLSIDRETFARTTTAGSKAFYGLLNSQYLVNSQTGEKYRDTKQGQSVYSKVYGKLGGENGGEMLNPQEVAQGYTDNRSCYNKNYAIKLVKKAIDYEKTLTDGYRDGEKLTLEFLTAQSPDESETVRDALTYLTTCFNSVCNPSGLEVEIKAVKDEDYYNTASKGNFDMIYSIWGGAANNPYGMMQVYIDPNFSKNCEYGFKGHQSEIELEIEFSDGTKATKTYFAWFDDIVKNYVEPSYDENATLTESQIENYNRIHTKRLDILAGVEAGVLSRFEAVPLVSRAQASMNSLKVEDGSDTYVTFVAFGGIREMKFNFDDKSWEEYLKKHNYDLTSVYIS